MKKLLFIALLIMGTVIGANSQQRYAVIDTKYILERIPAYKEADAKLKLVGEQWQKEIDDLQVQLDKMYKNYESEQFMLTERQRLIKPVQDKVYDAIQKIATSRSYDFVLDKSEGITIIFADPKLDKSDDVLKELGIK